MQRSVIIARRPLKLAPDYKVPPRLGRQCRESALVFWFARELDAQLL
jgi:hypothetical protein